MTPGCLGCRMPPSWPCYLPGDAAALKDYDDYDDNLQIFLLKICRLSNFLLSLAKNIRSYHDKTPCLTPGRYAVLF